MGNVINLAEKREQVQNASDPKMPKKRYPGESPVEKKFWDRVGILYRAWQKAKQEDMKISQKNSVIYYSWQQILFKWKVIDIMKLIPGEKK